MEQVTQSQLVLVVRAMAAGPCQVAEPIPFLPPLQLLAAAAVLIHIILVLVFQTVKTVVLVVAVVEQLTLARVLVERQLQVKATLAALALIEELAVAVVVLVVLEQAATVLHLAGAVMV
jgi:hypothetical protein